MNEDKKEYIASKIRKLNHLGGKVYDLLANYRNKSSPSIQDNSENEMNI